MNKMRDRKRNKLWFEWETGEVYYTFEECKHYTANSLKQRLKKTTAAAMRYIGPTMGYYPRNG